VVAPIARDEIAAASASADDGVRRRPIPGGSLARAPAREERGTTIDQLPGAM